jgi:hypothetical protein
MMLACPELSARIIRLDDDFSNPPGLVEDPKFYSKPWTVMRANFYWMKAQEFSESFCIPSEAIEYRDSLAKPSGSNVQ